MLEHIFGTGKKSELDLTNAGGRKSKHELKSGPKSKHKLTSRTSKNDLTIMKEYLIKEMQKKGKQILIERNGKSETYFYAAQRLKLDKTLDSKDPCLILSKNMLEKIVAIAKFCPKVATRATATVKEQTKCFADYLSEHVLIPDPQIDAFIMLLNLMEAKGDAILIETSPLEKIKKSYKEAAADLMSFTSAKDVIGKSDVAISNVIRNNLKKLVERNVQLLGYNLAIMNEVITMQTKLLTSFMLLQREKTEALDVLIDRLESNADNTILVHGNVRKSCQDAMYLLYGKTADHLRNVPEPHPILTKKLQIKLADLLKGTRDAHRPIMTTVLDETCNYLAYNFAQPLITNSCKCKNSKFIECNLSEEGNQRNTERPLCSCNQMDGSGPSSRPGLEIKECPVMAGKTQDGPSASCPVQDKGKPCPGK